MQARVPTHSHWNLPKEQPKRNEQVAEMSRGKRKWLGGRSSSDG
jgi:hypothetical protein